MNLQHHTHNPALRTIKPDWKGTPLDAKGRFVNHEFPFEAKFSEVLKWMWGPKPQKEEKQTDPFRLRNQNDSTFLNHTQDCLVWLGHATFFIRLGGINLLIDPVYYKIPLVKRYTPHAFNTKFFDGQLDYLLISHNHRDHCDERSIKEIMSGNPGATILTGLGMETLLRPWVNNAVIECAGWYQQYTIPGALEIFYLPSRHWSKRGLRDDNQSLWGAYVFRTQNKTIYFSGDSGYGSHFTDAKKLFPDIDVAIMGVGAYKPEWFMHPNHISPQDAVKAFHDLEAKLFIPMHYGTFDISDEPVGEPVRILKELEQQGLIKGELKLLDLAENFRV